MTPLNTPLLLVSDLVGEVLGVAPDDVTTAPRLRSYILTASDYLERLCNRAFSERVATRYYTALSLAAGGALRGNELWLDDDLRALTSVTNGDGNVISSANYTLLPKSADPNGVTVKHTIRLTPASGAYWTVGGNTDPVDSIAAVGLWGYGGGWLDTGATLSGGINASVTTLTASASTLEVGMTLKIDTEYLYVSAVSGTAITVARGYNGSTAAAHLTAAVIYRWQALELVQALVKRLTVYFQERVKAPLFGSAVIGDIVLPIDTSGIPADFALMMKPLKRPALPVGV